MSRSVAPVKTALPDIIHNNLANDVDCLKEITNLTKLAEEYADELEIAYRYNEVLNDADPIQAKAKFFAELNEGITVNGKVISLDDLHDEFVLYWIKKFRLSHEEVKKKFSKISTILDENDYFKDISDSIGLLTRVEESICDSDVQFYDTTYSNIEISEPFTIGISNNDKLDFETQLTIKEMSWAANGLFRQNMSKMIQTAAVADVAHGENLVTDYKHIQRMKDISDELNGIVADTLGSLYRILIYIRESFEFNRQVTQEFVNLSQIVEGTKIRIDTLGKKRDTFPSLLTNSLVLSVSGQPTR
tara:strand:+ start:3453 stop:4361 length:909 start_codon:yes stop_codon:yes gene_type:complete